MTKTHRTTEEEMEGPISFWGYKGQESNLILLEHDDDDDELLKKELFSQIILCVYTWQIQKVPQILEVFFFTAKALYIIITSLEVKRWIKKSTLTSFFALGMQSERNTRRNAQPIVGFSFTTMLQHTCRFCQRFLNKERDSTEASHILSWPGCS
jgi:hypothetical protein